ncbi:hypothetical protein LCGC14_2891070, partial [marine sediment metagenome]
TVLAQRFSTGSSNILVNASSIENYNNTYTNNGSMFVQNMYPNDFYNDTGADWQMDNATSLTNNVSRGPAIAHIGPALLIEAGGAVDFAENNYYSNVTVLKNINTTLINRYDSIGANMLLNYSITVRFHYNYTNFGLYASVANFTMNSTTYQLLSTGGHAEFNETMRFDSANSTNFLTYFNVSWGKLLVKEMNITIQFDAMRSNGYTRNISQTITIDYSNLGLTTHQKENGVWKLGFKIQTRNTSATDIRLGRENLWNGLNNWRFFGMIGIQYTNAAGTATNVTSTILASNISVSITRDGYATYYNIGDVITGLGGTEFLGFYLTFYVAGNPSYFMIDDLILLNDNAYEAPADGPGGGGGVNDPDPTPTPTTPTLNTTQITVIAVVGVL